MERLRDHQDFTMMEKRQLFLRSYQFSRKRTLAERVRRSVSRARRVIWFQVKSTSCRLRKLRLKRLNLYHMRRSRCLPLYPHHRRYNNHHIVLGKVHRRWFWGWWLWWSSSSSLSSCFL
ncbi:hypothetical protein MLD38_020693 [Melastoma candidum]|uniref:Uncharacterized protein n=1 Tax=Melastoma candidum TaxID=119954 RepID=A0ACB9QLU5_9MYRT|nr:hypothetical protein MLD38_020693 [Melastoma candidum]